MSLFNICELFVVIKTNKNEENVDMCDLFEHIEYRQ